MTRCRTKLLGRDVSGVNTAVIVPIGLPEYIHMTPLINDSNKGYYEKMSEVVYRYKNLNTDLISCRYSYIFI